MCLHVCWVRWPWELDKNTHIWPTGVRHNVWAARWLFRWTHPVKSHCRACSRAETSCLVTGCDRLRRGITHGSTCCGVFSQTVMCNDGDLGCLQPVIAEAAALHAVSCAFSWLISLLNARALLSARDVEVFQGHNPRTFPSDGTQPETERTTHRAAGFERRLPGAVWTSLLTVPACLGKQCR